MKKITDPNKQKSPQSSTWESVSPCSPPHCLPEGLKELIYSTVWGNWSWLFVHNRICVDSYWEVSTRSSEKNPKLIKNHIYIFGHHLLQGFVCLLLLRWSSFFIENRLRFTASTVNMGMVLVCPFIGVQQHRQAPAKPGHPGGFCTCS